MSARAGLAIGMPGRCLGEISAEGGLLVARD